MCNFREGKVSQFQIASDLELRLLIVFNKVQCRKRKFDVLFPIFTAEKREIQRDDVRKSRKTAKFQTIENQDHGEYKTTARIRLILPGGKTFTIRKLNQI